MHPIASEYIVIHGDVFAYDLVKLRSGIFMNAFVAKMTLWKKAMDAMALCIVN